MMGTFIITKCHCRIFVSVIDSKHEQSRKSLIHVYLQSLLVIDNDALLTSSKVFVSIIIAVLFLFFTALANINKPWGELLMFIIEIAFLSINNAYFNA